MLKKFRIYTKLRAKKYSEVLHLIPNDIDLPPFYLAAKAHCYFKLKQPTKSQELLDQLKRHKKWAYYAYNNKGYYYLDQFQINQAIPELRKATEISPGQSFALNNLGFAYMLNDKLEEGVKMVEESLKLSRHNYYAMRNIGVYYLLKKDFIAAQTVLKKAQSKDKTIDDIAYYLLICQLHLGDSNNKEMLMNAFSADEKERFEMIRNVFNEKLNR